MPAQATQSLKVGTRSLVCGPALPTHPPRDVPSWSPGDIGKSAGYGQAAGVGAGTGAAAGALATLISKKPSLKVLLRNMLIGGAGGAAIGSGVHALGNAGTQVAPSDEAPPASPEAPPAPEKDKMNLGVAAATGLLPGIGPAIHGGVHGGGGQAAISGLSSVVPSAPFLAGGSTKGRIIGSLLSALGATGAAHHYNRN